jgi:argininosuccinate synthase
LHHFHEATPTYLSKAFDAAEDVPNQMYSEANASMENIGAFDHADSEGFLRVLQVSARALAVNGQVTAPAWAG